MIIHVPINTQHPSPNTQQKPHPQPPPPPPGGGGGGGGAVVCVSHSARKRADVPSWVGTD